MTRPGYHVTAPRHWLNDPNGPIRWQGRWHLFFQHNPADPAWGPPHWGHVSSTDLAHWQRHPVALVPTPDTADADGCWSGCARVVDGVPTILYTGVVGHTDADRIESVLRATSHDDGLEAWVKDATPVIAGPPTYADTGFHRDPYTFDDRGTQYLLLGTSVTGTDGRLHGGVHVYRQAADGNWAHDGIMFDGSDTWDIQTGPLWECPQLLQFPEADVLLVSVQDPTLDRPLSHVLAFVGRFQDGRFTASHVEPFDRGERYYAPAATHADGRWIVWGWIQDPNPDLGPGNPRRQVGALSLPREVSVVRGRVVVSPVPEVAALRRARTHLPDVVVAPGTDHRVALDHAHAETVLTVEGPGCLDLTFDVPGDIPPAPVRIADVEGHGVEVRIFIDADIIEVHAAGASPVTTRTPAQAVPGIRLTAPDDKVRVSGIVIHELTPGAISP